MNWGSGIEKIVIYVGVQSHDPSTKTLIKIGIKMKNNQKLYSIFPLQSNERSDSGKYTLSKSLSLFLSKRQSMLKAMLHWLVKLSQSKSSHFRAIFFNCYKFTKLLTLSKWQNSCCIYLGGLHMTACKAYYLVFVEPFSMMYLSNHLD